VGRDNELVTIERPIRDLSVAPGAHLVEDVLVKNQTARAVEITATPQDLAVRRNGSSSLDIEDAGSQPRGAGDWLHIADATVRIEPFREGVIHVAIDVPRGAGPGAWAASALVSVAGMGPQSTVSLRQETAIAFLFTVQGDAQRHLGVSVHPSKRVRYTGGSLAWAVTIVNDGDSFESYGGHMRVKGLISGSRRYALKSGILFPGETRRQRIATQARSAPDMLTATVDVTSRGRSGAHPDPADAQHHATSRAVFVMPWWIPLVLLAAALVIWVRLRTRRSADGEVVEQYET
jgi:hypothetical protein